MLHAVYTRGRHKMISTISATQKFNAIHSIIRIDATELYVYRLRNNKDLETFIDEVSAVADKKTLLEIYNLATYCKLTAKNKDDMLYIRFDRRIVISNED